MSKRPEYIFGGDYSVDMWDKINKAKTKEDLKWALYLVCCRLQEMESKLYAGEYKPLAALADGQKEGE